MLEAFTAGLLLITVSELGDKTFFIAVILAMKHSRRLVFLGAWGALAAMTVLSVLFGQVVSLLPPSLVRWAEVLLFLGFGLKLLYDAWRMKAIADGCEEGEAMEAVARAESNSPPKPSVLAIVFEVFSLTFLAEWGDRTQIATIALAAAKHPLGVTVGAILGHAICTAIAVIGGRAICGRISERTVTLLSGILFLIFAGVAATRLG
ncbi:TMEM165/GDT1 family protein [Leptolyngbya sp. CCY15150]|uniref:TMEM165/GDT1 family protein n=1 Tax=Leptolyngbya sp. CCY15150 TaxID=2767772 RepID=UPI001951A5D0